MSLYSLKNYGTKSYEEVILKSFVNTTPNDYAATPLTSEKISIASVPHSFA